MYYAIAVEEEDQVFMEQAVSEDMAWKIVKEFMLADEELHDVDGFVDSEYFIGED